MGTLFHSVRRALGVRRSRALLPVGPRPRQGAKIVREEMRMTVQAGLTESTWAWLVAQGWREEPYRGDRRAYREVPPSRVAELLDAQDGDELRELLNAAMAEAEFRPVITLPRRR